VADPVLETERLVLRRFAESDADDLVALDGDPEVMRYLTGGVPTPRAEVLAFLRRHLDHPELGVLAAEDRVGTFLGWLSLLVRPDERPGHAELGYRLTRACWGRGYATEGAKALVRRGFTERGLDRVYAETMVVNTGSRRVMEKTGLKQVRIFHLDWAHPIDGSEHGEVEYALTRAEWLRRSSGG